ncbi:MerR family transcriptional regulator [Actinomadura citrea]|uniref:DNA-binding transcriptional MerR regulator n=1 Tax=Actinomadura citrea TaxID=46158 RepID=A0A7Y9G4W9_9ACTN|nr:MerR family transcriptional regulator [Actinomadura citrea]NYE09962.1 DNA-binding transcriptional MerR regulator [Actinomadura citrea]GGT68991.1 MerR family transcriptional regulator [Actinomadura citrea]
MRIGDAAAAAGTTPRALRFYEQRGLLPPPSRTSGGQRRYGPREVARVLTIRRLLSLGLTIEDIRGCADRLDLLDGDALPPYGGPGCAGSAGVARRRLAVLDAEIARLTVLRDALATQIGGTDAAGAPAAGPSRGQVGRPVI